jgi:flagellar assembly factor FliW
MSTLDTTELEITAVRRENIIHLPKGLLGFETIQKYVLLANPEEAPFEWLQVLDRPDLAFLVLSPFEVLANYEMKLGEEDVEFLNLASPADALVRNIVTLRPMGTSTINLKGPIVINRNTLIGKQVILANAADYELQQPLPTAD